MTGLFSLTYGNIAVSALIVCGIAALFGLAGRVVWYRVKVALDDRFYPPRPELLDEYADDVPNHPYTEDTGRHAAVPLDSANEMTLYGGFTSAGGAL